MSESRPPAARLDHLVVIAPALDVGAAWVRARLGADCRPGGRHTGVGTHNRLLRLGDDAYLEVIAPDPGAPPPSRPRWFGLDALAPDESPRLAAWVARSEDILSASAASPEPLGPVVPVSRGDLHWLLTVPTDGSLPLDGAGPLLIQWDSADRPPARLPADGFSLVRLLLGHPHPDRVRRLLAAIGFIGPVDVVASDRANLAAEIRTPAGTCRLSVAE
jgi:hypothetical protein